MIPRRARWAFVPEVVVGVVAAVVYGSWVGRPGVWRDEAATLTVCRRSLQQIVDLFHNGDLVHFVYYLLAHTVLAFGGSVAAVRLLSVGAFALTAVMLVLIGRRLGSVPLGTLAGLILVTIPLASRYAQEARPPALITLAATVSTYVVLGAVEEPGRRRRWLFYGLTVLALALVNVLALLILPVHAILVLLAADRRARGGWAATVLAACTVAAPFAAATYSQRDQVSWLQKPPPHDLTDFFVAEFGSRAVPVAGIAAGIAVLLLYRGLPAGPEGIALVLGASWAAVPPVVLWSVSQVRPLWDLHYVVFALPGTALALASVTLLLGDRLVVRRLPILQAGVAAATLFLLTALGWQVQVAYREPVTGHEDEDIFTVGAYLAGHAEPGDGVLFLPADLRVIEQEDATAFAALHDVALKRSAVDSATINGDELDPVAMTRAMAEMHRIWLVSDLDVATGLQPVASGTADAAKMGALAAGFRQVCSAEATFDVDLYVRAAPSQLDGEGDAIENPDDGTCPPPD
jgi:mannosyltransferase